MNLSGFKNSPVKSFLALSAGVVLAVGIFVTVRSAQQNQQSRSHASTNINGDFPGDLVGNDYAVAGAVLGNVIGNQNRISNGVQGGIYGTANSVVGNVGGCINGDNNRISGNVAGGVVGNNNVVTGTKGTGDCPLPGNVSPTGSTITSIPTATSGPTNPAPTTPPGTISTCRDGIDNDSNGFMDYFDSTCHTDNNPQNPNSYDPTRPGEQGGYNTCADSKDNNNNGLVDGGDPICHTDSNAGNHESYNPDAAEGVLPTATPTSTLTIAPTAGTTPVTTNKAGDGGNAGNGGGGCANGIGSNGSNGSLGSNTTGGTGGTGGTGCSGNSLANSGGVGGHGGLGSYSGPGNPGENGQAGQGTGAGGAGGGGGGGAPGQPGGKGGDGGAGCGGAGQPGLPGEPAPNATTGGKGGKGGDGGPGCGGTVSPTITSGVTPTAPVNAGNVTINLSLLLHGIGKGGDSANPGSGGNPNPLHPQRDVAIQVFNQQNSQVDETTTKVTFNQSSGSFNGSVQLNTPVTNGIYTIKLMGMRPFLNTFVPGIQSLTSGAVNQLPITTMVNGDINGDNTVNILDYNILTGCYSDFLPAVSCTSDQKLSADIDDDGNVAQFDYNLFLRELTNRAGN